MAARAANPTPAGSMEPCQGSVSSSTPSSAMAGHVRARRLWLRSVATVSGPRNSTATAVPSGMRSIAARKAVVTRPVATPRPSRAGTSAPRTVPSGGRASTRNTSAPRPSLSQAVPAAPTVEIRGIDSAEPSCTDSMAATARPHGGTPARPALPLLMSGVLRGYVGGDQPAGHTDVRAEPGQVSEQILRGGGERVVGQRVERVENEQRRRRVLSQLGAAGLAPVPAPAGHARVVAPHHLAGVRVLDDGPAIGDGVEGFATGGAEEPRGADVAGEVLA